MGHAHLPELHAYVGAEMDGRSGAILGSALGAAAGSAITTSHHRERDHVGVHRVYREKVIYRPHHHEHVYRYDYNDHRGYRGRDRGSFCPPGQGKKGRC